MKTLLIFDSRVEFLLLKGGYEGPSRPGETLFFPKCLFKIFYEDMEDCVIHAC